MPQLSRLSPTRKSASELVEDGQDPFPSDELTPEALAAFQQREIAQRWPIVKAAGIKSE